MKAFQLKIVIKNSKPPIWRRVIVPTGITFSQLSMILNEVMGWSGYHLFEFEFYHKELRIIEGAADFDLIGPYDYLEARTTFIREFMEENDWFSYTYDLGDDWQHRVTIEKIIDDWECNYPKVIKYKGDCPIEDCGGIYGYYDCLEIIGDVNHSEYEERLSWMESQGYPQRYDMDYVNEQLEYLFFYNIGKRETRCQQILKEIPVEYMEFVIKNNKLYHKEFWPDDKGLLSAQGNKRYYIPTKAEIVNIGVRGYLSEDKYIKKFQKYLIIKLGAMEDEADFAGRMIWRLICGDYGMQAIYDVLEDLGLMVDSEKELHSLIGEIHQLWNHTRKILNRGYTPGEMRQGDIASSNSGRNNIVNFEDVKKNKIYPNDPCPCGSGKK